MNACMFPIEVPEGGVTENRYVERNMGVEVKQRRFSHGFMELSIWRVVSGQLDQNEEYEMFSFCLTYLVKQYICRELN